MDEAGRRTQSPLIMASPDLKSEPDETAADNAAGDGIVSSSTSPSPGRATEPRPAPVRRASESGGTRASRRFRGAAKAATEGLPAAGQPADAGPGTTAPLPADTIGGAKSRSGQGEAAGEGQGAESQGGQQAVTSGEKSNAAGQAVPAGEPAPGGTGDRQPTFTAPETASGPAYADPGYPVPGGGYAPSDWAAGLNQTAATPAAATTADLTSPAPGATGTSATSAWPKRGPRGFQARKSSKRQAMLTLSRVEPWSVMKFSFVVSVVAFIILFVAVALLYMLLAGLGVFDSLQHTISSVTSSQSAAGTNIAHYLSASRVLGYTAMLGALNIVLITAMCTVGSVIYNLIAKTVGGIEVTLRETD